MAAVVSLHSAGAAAKTNADFDKWTGKWQLIQRPDNTVDWIDHYQVCAIKFRYRNYGELFHCLDLLEAKIAQGGKYLSHLAAIRHEVPLLTGWMRATAYAELGEPEVALKWAEIAFSTLPKDMLKNSGPSFGIKKEFRDFAEVTTLLTGSSTLVDDATRENRDNPAGLDLSAETLGMTLAAQRALLYVKLGERDKANLALAELRQWEDVNRAAHVSALLQTTTRYQTRAQLLSIGPLFAMGEYAQVVKVYAAATAEIERKRRRQQFYDTLGKLWLPGLIVNSLEHLALLPFTPSDARLFEVAIEDSANALVYAQSLARLGKSNEARSMLDTLLALPEIRGMGGLYWVALYERGLIALKEGKRDDAIRLFKQSVEAIESVRSTIAFEATKIGFAGDKQAVYAVLVAALFEAGNWSDAFLMAERAKARALVDLLAQRRDLAPPPAVDDRVRSLFANASTIEGSGGLPVDDQAIRGVKVVADARVALSSAAPEAASLMSVQQVSIAEIAARLAADETLIDYYRADDALYALIMNGTTIKGFMLSAVGLDDDVKAFRAAIERRDPQAADRGRPLYDRLIRPLLGDIKGSNLIISPHGVLHYLPFVALMDGDQYLIDRFSLRLIPSAGMLVYLKNDHPAKTGKLLALGNPDLGNARFDLPNAQIEAVNVAALFPASRALVRADASKTAIKELGNGFSILHIATHGKFNTDDPLSSGLYLAKGNETDGVLTVGDLYTLRWDTDLVTLSACETGLGEVANGDDVIGLTLGFLYAGARSIVASLWAVDDAATEQLMVSFYRNLDTHDKRESLRLAQIETRKTYPHLMFWAAFQIVGRGD